MTKEKRKSKLELSFPQIIKNFGFATKLMLKIYPLKFVFQILLMISTDFIYFFSNSYMLRFVVNGMQEGRSFSSTFIYLLFMIFLNLTIDGILSAVYDVFLPIIDCKSEKRLNLLIYRHSLELDLENYENPEAFDLYDRAVSNGAGAIADAVVCIEYMISTLLNISLNAYLLIDIDPVLFVFVCVPWLFIPLHMLIEKKKYQYNVETRNINRRKDYARRTFFEAEFAKEMRLTNLHRVMQRRFSDSVKEYIHLIKTRGLRCFLLQEFESLSSSFLSVHAARIYSVYRTLVSGTMMYGDCLVSLRVVSDLSSKARNVTEIFPWFYAIALNINDYRIFMEKEPKVSPNINGQSPKAGDIEFKNVSFRYDGSYMKVLNHISLKIRQGERIAIVGPNGAGKTTLVKLLMRLYNPSEGEICVAGNNIREYKLKEYRRSYGVVFQDYRQMAFTVAENVLGRPCLDSDEKTVWRALECVGLDDIVARLPNGIHTVMTKEFSEEGLLLSGGQSQKLAIASIFANESNSVILDEPSSALDPIAEREMYNNMLAASDGKTVIFISHRLSSCVDADRIFYIENGTLEESGTHRQLMHRGGRYAKMFQMQAENYADSVTEGEARDE